jgi:peroxiredoxin
MTLTTSTNKLNQGNLAPDFSLKATDNKSYTLSDFSNKPLLIIFMCNHCPYVIAKLPELNKISQDFPDLKVIGINSNESEKYPDDSFENMQKEVESDNIQFLYLHDENQEVAKAYGAVCTPDPFLFDSNHKLIFHSRIGDPPNTSPSIKHELHNAIQEYLKTGKISQNEFPSTGCSIKWKIENL